MAVADAQDSPDVERILAVVDRYPGLGINELAHAAELPGSTTHRLVHALSVKGEVRLVRDGLKRRVTRPGKHLPSPLNLLMQEEPELKMLLEWLREHPGSMQKAVLDFAQAQWNWPRSTTQHRLGRLLGKAWPKWNGGAAIEYTTRRNART